MEGQSQKLDLHKCSQVIFDKETNRETNKQKEEEGSFLQMVLE